MEQNQLVENLIQELRRGVISLAVISQLQEEQYGYSVKKLLSEHGLEVDQGTLYPLLRRLEAQGVLESKWRLEEARPRRYYVISPAGRKVLPQLQEEWQKIITTIAPLLERKDQNGND
jgi:PadR family transcriptional regulator, regulatory protein PadR